MVTCGPVVGQRVGSCLRGCFSPRPPLDGGASGAGRQGARRGLRGAARGVAARRTRTAVGETTGVGVVVGVVASLPTRAVSVTRDLREVISFLPLRLVFGTCPKVL